MYRPSDLSDQGCITQGNLCGDTSVGDISSRHSGRGGGTVYLYARVENGDPFSDLGHLIVVLAASVGTEVYNGTTAGLGLLEVGWVAHAKIPSPAVPNLRWRTFRYWAIRATDVQDIYTYFRVPPLLTLNLIKSIIPQHIKSACPLQSHFQTHHVHIIHAVIT
jgi:hypothetical protein